MKINPGISVCIHWTISHLIANLKSLLKGRVQPQIKQIEVNRQFLLTVPSRRPRNIPECPRSAPNTFSVCLRVICHKYLIDSDCNFILVVSPWLSLPLEIYQVGKMQDEDLQILPRMTGDKSRPKALIDLGFLKRNLHLIHPPPTPLVIHSKSSWFLRWAPDMCALFGEFCWNDSFNFYITSLKSPGFGRNRLIFCWKQRRKYWCRETGLMVHDIFSSSVWGTWAETNAMETCATLTNETHAVGLEYGEAKPILVFVTACNSMEDHQSYIIVSNRTLLTFSCVGLFWPRNVHSQFTKYRGCVLFVLHML